MDNESNPREELYKRFRQALIQPITERFFDEDELVEIYDYAGDINDDYAQLEVLLCGARLYPESVPLAERKALLYLDTTDDRTAERTGAAESFLADNPDASSILFDIARLEVSHPANAAEALSFLLEQYNSFDDEEIIRFVDLAINLNEYNWLIENFDAISAKVPFKPSLLYEIAREADDRDDNETLIKMADSLIELEPFTPTYWMMLLRGQARLDRREEARQTFDYAKALAADAPDAILALTDIVYNNAPYLLKEMVESVRQLAEQNPDDFSYTDCLCAVLSQTGSRDTVIHNLLRDFLNSHPANAHALRQFLMYNTRDAATYIEAYFNALPVDSALGFDAEDIINTLAMRGAFAAAEKLAECIRETFLPNDESIFSMLIEIMFRRQRFQKVVDICENNKDVFSYAEQNPYKGAVNAYMYALSLVKTGRHADAISYARGKMPYFHRLIKAAPMPVRMTIRCFMTFVDKLERHGAEDKLYWEYFDMLSIGKF